MRFATLACALVLTVGLALVAPFQQAGAATSVSFVGAGHSDPAAQRQKSVVVPAGTQPGDTLVMVFTHATSVSWSGPAGITGWRQVDSFAGANALTSTLWVKTVTSSDLAASVHFDSSTYRKAMLTLADYTGVDAAADVTVAHAADAISSTSHVAPSETVTAGAQVLSYWVDKSDTTTTWTGPNSSSTRDTAIGTGTGRFSSLLTDTGPTDPGASGPTTATTNAASKALAWTIALSPTSGTTPPPTTTKLMVIWEENETSAILDSMPYLKSMSDTYGKATSYSGLVHPSLGNYLAAASGQGASTCGLSDPLPAACPQSGPTVFGQALTGGKTAKTYSESMTSSCQRTNSSLYAARHNPWVYFNDETTSCTRLDVPLGTTSSGALLTDVNQGTLPNASMVVPNLQNDLHNGTAQQADTWLSQWLPVIMAGPDYQSGKLAIVVTFDEGIGSNQTIPFVVVSPNQSHRVVATAFNHYALCRLYDDILGVTPLGSAAGAPGLRAAFRL